jgi:GT2 family glycosyltransferase
MIISADDSAQTPKAIPLERLGAIAIGRNEGDRLRRCLESLARLGDRLVYVDSGSTDGSLELAEKFGATIVNLDTSRPFSAARARNAGFERLLSVHPEIEWVQFVDGDCEVVSGWLETALAFLTMHPDVAVVCGRRRERFPDATIYNEICDIEWDTDVGEARSCGGDAMMRRAAFEKVGGYRPTLVAGEEPELCLRLRAQGHRIFRLDHDMTLHDAAIEQFSQWWRRMVRGGYAYAAGKHLHGGPPERHFKREVDRIYFWGMALPACIVTGLVPTFGLSTLLSAGYAVSAYRCFKNIRSRGRSPKSAATYATLVTVGRFAELQGALRFRRELWQGRDPTLIEYK